jgi:PPOX class probable F420-dependent enzyme
MASLQDALVQQLLKGRYIASLATQRPDGSLHMVAVWYWFDGTHIFIATASRSRKARNLTANARAALMIDSRDPAASCGVTISGTVETLSGEASRQPNARVHEKYMSGAALADPKVGPVFAVWDDLTLRLTPASVITWDMRVADQQAFGGAFAANPGYLLPLER